MSPEPSSRIRDTYYAPHSAWGGICLAYADSPAGPWKEYEANPLIAREWAPYEGVAVTTKMFDAISEASYARVFRYTLPGKDSALQEDWPKVGASEWVNRFALLYPMCVLVVFFAAWLVGFVSVELGWFGE